MKARYYFKNRKLVRKVRKQRKQQAGFSYLEMKARFFSRTKSQKEKKKALLYYWKVYNRRLYLRYRLRRICRFLIGLKLPVMLSFVRWVIVDFLRAKQKPFLGVYCYVAMPGQGKTLSMTRHINVMRKRYPGLLVATNYNYQHQDAAINDWTDIIKFSKFCEQHKRKHIIAIDEIHLTFDSSDWKSFPQVLQVILSQNRHLQLQFLCTAQRYDRIPTKVKCLANYVVICKNILSADRLFFNYFYQIVDYEDGFKGKRKKADFTTRFIADDALYGSYNTMEMCDRMVESEQKEKDKRREAMDLLFGNAQVDEYEHLIPAGDSGEEKKT